MIKYIQLLGLLVILGIPLTQQSTPLEILKLKVFDSLVPEKEESGYFSILSINEEDIEQEGGYPIPRKRLAEIQEALINRGALGVGWVIAFPQPDRFGGDNEFSQSLKKAPSVLAVFENENGNYPSTSGTVILGEDIGGFKAKGVIENIDILKNSASQGIAIAPTDVDQLVRRMPLLMRMPDGWVSSYGTEVLKVLAGADTYLIKTNSNGVQEIRVKGLPPVSTDSLGRKWISWIKTPEFSLNEVWSNQAEIRNKFVFVGITAKGIMPQIATPVGLLEPHKIQTALSESILIQDSPYIPDYAASVELLTFVLSVALIWLFLQYLGITWGLLSGVGIMALTAYLGVYFASSGILIDFTWSLISEFITGSVAFYLRFRQQFKLRQQIKKQFEHYLDPRQVKQLQKNPELLHLGGETRTCTYLFTDLRGFTSMSEKLSPEEVTEIMNATLSVQVTAVQKYGGMVDKFIGDACMAIFNAPLDLEDHETRAVECAIEIQKEIKELNKELPVDVAIGVGLNTGPAVVGNMGSNSRFDFSAIGNSVNEAARYESATKDVGVDILIGESTAKASKIAVDYVKSIMVKGKSKELKVYTA